MEERGYDTRAPFVRMYELGVNGVCECPVCEGRGRVKPPKGRKLIECPNCLGAGRERVPWEVQSIQLKELGQYIAPKRKAIEHRGTGSGFNLQIVIDGRAAEALSREPDDDGLPPIEGEATRDPGPDR